MGFQFNTDRPKLSEEEINKHKDFEKLVQNFKEQSIKQAKGDESWWKNKVVRYSTIIAGVTVICTITYNSLFNQQTDQKKNEKITTTSTASPATKTNKINAAIRPASPKIAKSYSTYTVNNAVGGAISHPSGTRLNIPKNSFVDKNGKTIVGEVTIEYREFQNSADVIASGIPMQYDSAGITRQLETAGMFDIKGNQAGTAVYVAPSKEIEVALHSEKARDGFHQYALDTISGNWTYLRADKAVANTDYKSVINRIEKNVEGLEHEIKVVIPKKIDSIQIISKSSIAKLPTYVAPQKPRKGISGRPTFKLDGSYNEFPELASFDNVLFEVGPENNNYSKELHEITWSDVKVSQGPKKGLNYLLTLKYRTRTEKLIVYPVLSGKDLELANEQYSQRLQDYEQRLSKREADEKMLLVALQQKQKAYLEDQKAKELELKKEKERLALVQLEREKATVNRTTAFASSAAMASATRVFRISEFGIYNSDCPHNVPKAKTISPIFVLNASAAPVMASRVYLIDHTHQTVFDLPADRGFVLQMDENTVYSLCVFKGDKIFVCNKEHTLQAQEHQSNKFNVKELSFRAEEMSKFKSALEI